MTRTQNSIRYDEGRTKYVTRIEDHVTIEEVPNRGVTFLIELGENLALLRCGASPFETLTLRVEDGRWIAIAEATESVSS